MTGAIAHCSVCSRNLHTIVPAHAVGIVCFDCHPERPPPMMQQRKRPEHVFQARLIKYLGEHAYPEIPYFAIGNGELRHPRVALRLKAEGVMPGVADICFLLPFGRTGWLELKARRGTLSDAQKGFAAKVKRQGHYWDTARNMDDAIMVLKHWGVLRPQAPYLDEH